VVYRKADFFLSTHDSILDTGKAALHLAVVKFDASPQGILTDLKLIRPLLSQ
jgi:hypothetical protein